MEYEQDGDSQALTLIDPEQAEMVACCVMALLRQTDPRNCVSPDNFDTFSGTEPVPCCLRLRGRIFWLVSRREEIRTCQTRGRKPRKQSRRRLLQRSSLVRIKGTKAAKRWLPRGRRSRQAWLQPKYRVSFAPIYSSGSLPLLSERIDHLPVAKAGVCSPILAEYRMYLNGSVF